MTTYPLGVVTGDLGRDVGGGTEPPPDATHPVTHLSYSAITLYHDCPRAWWRRYVLKEREVRSGSLVFGSALHKVFETWLRGNAAGVAVDAAALWPAIWEAAVDAEPVAWGGDDPDTLGEIGAAIVAHPEIGEHVGGLMPLVIDGQPAVEMRFTLRVPGVDVPVIGYIDCISRDGVVVDFKTANRAWGDERAAGEMQAAFYLAAQGQMGLAALNPRRHFRHIVVTKAVRPRVDVYETTRSAADLFEAMAMARSVWQGIVAGAFPVNPGAWRCRPRFCGYWHDCVGKDNPDELLGF